MALRVGYVGPRSEAGDLLGRLARAVLVVLPVEGLRCRKAPGVH